MIRIWPAQKEYTYALTNSLNLYDNFTRLYSSEGTASALRQVGPALFGSTGVVPPPESNDFLCPLLNITECHITEENNQVGWDS